MVDSPLPVVSWRSFIHVHLCQKQVASPESLRMRYIFAAVAGAMVEVRAYG